MCDLIGTVFGIILYMCYCNRWKIKADDCPLAHPYVLFRRGLLLELTTLQG
jgi:hypothetical protein